MNNGGVIAWSGFGQMKTGGKVNKKDWPKWMLHSKPDPRPSSPFRERKGVTTIIRPE